MENAVLTFATVADAERFIAWLNDDKSADFRGEWQIDSVA